MRPAGLHDAHDRETLEVDILIVGGGPAGLSAALRLAQLQKREGGEPLSIAVLEKAREAGAHQLSGALLDPSALQRSDPRLRGEGRAARDARCTRTTSTSSRRKNTIRLPITPPPFRNHGNYIISLNKFTKWLAAQVEGARASISSRGFPGQSVLFDGAQGRLACARATRASASTASRRPPSSRAPTSSPRSRSSPTASAATSPRS